MFRFKERHSKLDLGHVIFAFRVIMFIYAMEKTKDLLV